VPEPVEVVLKMLGGSASPCALIALGLFLAEKREGAGDTGSTALLVALKLFLQPAIAWGIAALIFKLPPLLIHAAVLLAALPTGTGPFMLAEYYRREALITAKVILISTMLSVLTLSAYLAWGV
jgi:predicted permease